MWLVSEGLRAMASSLSSQREHRFTPAVPTPIVDHRLAIGAADPVRDAAGVVLVGHSMGGMIAPDDRRRLPPVRVAFAAQFTNAPSVDATVAWATGHSLDHHRLGHALHMRQVAFAEECVLRAARP